MRKRSRGRPPKKSPQHKSPNLKRVARSLERLDSRGQDHNGCRRDGCVRTAALLAKLQDAERDRSRERRSARRSTEYGVSERISLLQGSMKRLKHEVEEQHRARERERRKIAAERTHNLELENARLRAELQELHRDLDGDLPWKERYDTELANYRNKCAKLKETRAALKAQLAEAVEAVAEKSAAHAARIAGKTKARATAKFDAAKAEGEKQKEAMDAKFQAVQDAAADITEAFNEKRLSNPRPPKEYSIVEFDSLGDEAARKARSREMKYLHAMLHIRGWRATSVATVLSNLGLLEGVMQSKEGAAIFSMEVRQLMGVCEGVHWGVNFGLFLHLEEKCPTRLIRRMRAASAEVYDPELDRGKRKPLWCNPHDWRDVIYVPYTIPAPTAYAEEVLEYAHLHGLRSSADGSAAVQSVELLIPHVITRDYQRQPTLEWSESGKCAPSRWGRG